ncbi:MAG: ABC transporter ATP-binding protein/permease [Ruminococcaceae bacterium]|nr:ABC transporter ATP-binding protein/permease [Oscillospiraceae bacterium]
MLKLKDITKTYDTGTLQVQALKSVSMEFRKSEFVAILGPSGCGKTTLLNIIGGLDQYTSGDLVINGTSTKQYKDSDWDAYRNHKIGFVFQSYNLISHQSVLSNVELALTLSGVGKAERKKRAMEALEKVGLKDQAHKKPNQMSGGQMQRVAIARALVNNPDILLADEPTGALDSETSIQIMEILKEIANEKLVIMVTHNPELAEQYSNRIIRLLDGEVVSDTNVYIAEEKADVQEVKKKKYKTSMSFFTALSLSFNNLLTKKGRTFMTSFAGSIGIIGIALILALSSGVDLYIEKVESETLSSYPLTIESATMDMSSLMMSMMSMANKEDIAKEENTAYSNDVMMDMLEAVSKEVVVNDLKSFKFFLESKENGFAELTSDIKYTYTTPMHIYKKDTSKGVLKVNPSQVFDILGFNEMMGISGDGGSASMGMMSANMNVWTELMNNRELLEEQYEIYGEIPNAYNQAVIILDKNAEISDYSLYTLGIKDTSELSGLMKDLASGKEITSNEEEKYTFDYLMSLSYKVLPTTDYFEYSESEHRWVDKSSDNVYIKQLVENASKGFDVDIVGVFVPKEDAKTAASGGMVGYHKDLMPKLIEQVNNSDVVKAQKENSEYDIFTGQKFSNGETFDINKMTQEEIAGIVAQMPAEMQAQFMSMTKEQQMMAIQSYMGTSTATYDGNLELMGVADVDNPSVINIYPVDFEAKEKIVEKIKNYNEGKSENDKIQYTDYIGIMMSSVTTIINSISYILIAFVAISLIVSSIMIGIITYISVLERTKEIGILRSIGASKKDISRVFNAETLIVGFVAGLIGIGVTCLLIIPINIIIELITDINGLAHLPWQGAIILVVISMCLTLIAGLIPSRFAAKKDPVVALRTE